MDSNNFNNDFNNDFDIEPSAPPMPPVSAPQTPPSFMLSADKVQAVRFHPAKPGYEFRQVETFVDQVSNTLNFLESQIYQYQVELHEKQDEVYDLQDTISKLKATIEVFRASGDPVTASDGSYLTASKVADNEALEALKTERDALQAKVIELQNELLETKNVLKELEIEKEKLAKQLMEFKENSISPSDLATLKAEKDILVEQLVQLKEKEEASKSIQKELEESKTNFDLLKSQTVSIEEHQKIITEKLSLEAKIVELESSIEAKIVQERDELRKEIEELNANASMDITENEEYVNLLSKLTEVEKELTTVKDDNAKLSKELSEHAELEEQAAAVQELEIENEALKSRLKELETKLINSKPIEQDRELIKTLESERNSLATQLAAAKDDADNGWKAHEELKNYVDNTLMPWIASQNQEEPETPETVEEKPAEKPIVEEAKVKPANYDRLASSPEFEEMPEISIPYVGNEEENSEEKEEIKPAGAPLPRFLATAPEVLAAMEEEE